MPRLRFAFVCWFVLCGVCPCLWADEPTYQGSARCIDCHTHPSGLRLRDGTTDWVTLTEAQTWLTLDSHAQAFKSLETDDARAIGKRLGIDDVTKDQSCLGCHAGWLKGLPPPPGPQLGVSCEACHGPSSLYDAEHTKPPWRIKTADEKAVLGMVEMRDPRLRAEQCLSCHLGNASEGKLLTHAIYAAGHPPLGGFELATFSEAMPPHWRELPDKGDAVRGNAEIRRALGYREGDVPEVKGVIIAGVCLARESARLDRAWRAATAESGDWPDFAQYDCAACHHELERPSWRQTRAKQPGKLLPPAWPTALVEVAIRHVARDDANGAERFRREIEERAAAHGDLSGTLDGLLSEVDRLASDRPAADHVLHDLAELGQQPYLDFDSARQMGWAFRSVYRAIEPSQPNERAAEGLAKLSSLLQLDLPSKRQTIESPEHRPALFRAVGDYQPRLANRYFAELAAYARRSHREW